MKTLLFKNADYRRTSRMITDLWVLRRHLLKELEEDIPQKEKQKAPKFILADKPNLPQSGPPQCGLPQNRIQNQPQSDPPQYGLPQSRKPKPPLSGSPQCGLPQCRIKYQPQSNPPQRGLPQSRMVNITQNNLPPSRIQNPPQCGPPQCGLPPSRKYKSTPEWCNPKWAIIV